VFWGKIPSTPTDLIHQNIAFKFLFVYNITTVIDFSRNVLLIGDTLNLDGSQSYVTNSDDPDTAEKGLRYDWLCPSLLQAYCQSRQYQSVVRINHQEFLDSGCKYNESYEFTLRVWHIDFTDAAFEESIQIKWLNASYPDF